jgi:hypothetical protein
MAVALTLVLWVSQASESPTADSASWQSARDTRDYTTLRNWYRSNTGIAAAGLRDQDLQRSGSIASSRDGQVIDGLLVSGQIVVRHDNVTIRNTKVVNNGGLTAIDIPWEGRMTVNKLTLENVSVVSTETAQTYAVAISAAVSGFANWGSAPGIQASRVYVSGFGTGFMMSHHGADRIEYSMVENIKAHAGSHNNGLDARGGKGKRLMRNWIEGSTSSALAQYPQHAAFTDVLIQENLFDGGTYSVYGGVDINGENNPTYVRFIDNLFTRNHQYGPVTAWNGSGTGNVWSGNTYLDGTRIG